MSLKESPSIVPSLERKNSSELNRTKGYFAGLESLKRELRRKDELLRESQAQVEALRREKREMVEENERREIDYRQRLENIEISHDQTLGELESAKQENSLLVEQLERLRAEIESATSGDEVDLDSVLLRLVTAATQLSAMDGLGGDLAEVASGFPIKDQFETESFDYSGVIDRLGLVEDLAAEFDGGIVVSEIATKLKALSESFIELLSSRRVEQISFKPGSRLTSDSLSKARVVSAEDCGDPQVIKEARSQSGKGGKNIVISTIRPGYIYRNGRLDVMLRKAEVVLSD